MARGRRGGGEAEGSENAAAREEYELMLRLERLESLQEEMEELGVTSLEEVRRRIDELHRLLDERQG